MNFIAMLFQSILDFVRRNPIFCIVVVALAVLAPSVLVGAAKVFLYIILGVLALMLIVGVVLRFKIRQLQRQAQERGEDFSSRSYSYRWGRGFASTDAESNEEGDVQVHKTSQTPPKRVSGKVGDYVDFEEVDSADEQSTAQDKE